MRVVAVIPNWNGARLLKRLFPTIAAQTRPFDSVLVVDNGSTDESRALAKQFGAQVIPFDSNRGFAPAVNAGVAAAVNADIVAILNNDVELQPDWLEQAMPDFNDPAVSFVTGKTVRADNPAILDGSFDAVCRGGCALRCGAGRRDGPYWDTPRTIQFAPFTAILVRRAHFQAAGGLDEDFESYMEDVAFGLRCAAIGYTGRYHPSAVATHIGSATLGSWSPRTVRKISRNQVLLVVKYYDRRLLWRFGWSIAVAQVLWGLVSVRHGTAMAWIAGKVDALMQIRSFRGAGDPAVGDIVCASERLIREVQTRTGFDWYWRLYLALCPPNK